MSTSSPKVPGVADPSTVTNAQQTYNTMSAEENQAASAVNQINPYSSLTYQQTGWGPNGVPLYTATQTLNPQQQNLLDILTGNQSIMGTQATKLLSGANYGGASPSSVIGDATTGNTNALMSSFNQYIQPFFTNQSESLDSKLRNQGLTPSATATSDPSTWGPYERAMNQLNTSQGQTEAGAVSQFEPLAYSQATQNYLMPLNIASQEIGMSQPNTGTIVNTPQFNSQPANYIGATANEQSAQMQAYQAQLAQNQAMMSGLFGIPTAVLGGWARSPSGGSMISSGMAGMGSMFGAAPGAAGFSTAALPMEAMAFA